MKNDDSSDENNASVAKSEQDLESLALASQLQSLKVVEEDTPVSLQKVARLIQNNQAKKILVLSGAGVSCSAGIPDFRSPGTGL